MRDTWKDLSKLVAAALGEGADWLRRRVDKGIREISTAFLFPLSVLCTY